MSLQRSYFRESPRAMSTAAHFPAIFRPLASQPFNALPILANFTSSKLETAASRDPECGADAPAPMPRAAPLLPDTPRCLTIVTGASRGLGAAIARVLAAKGPPLPLHAATAAATASGHSGRSSSAASVSPHHSATCSSWTHDLVLLATDSARLSRFVHEGLQPLLEQQQPEPQVCAAFAGSRETVGSSSTDASINAFPPAPTATNTATMVATPAATSTTAINTEAATTTTRVRTVCFDLGDLDSLEANIARLLSPTDVGAAEDGNGTEAGGSSAGGSSSGDAAGVLPLPPSAYTHVLLVHNAGQVGDLVPLELQGLANMRRQTDINVTAFAYLTAAVMRAFLHTPLAGGRGGGSSTQLQPQQALHSAAENGNSGRATADGTPAGNDADPHRGEATSAMSMPGKEVHPPQRRLVSIVNISSVSVDQPYEHFSLYGMGKAARHMIVRSIAHEAALREADEVASGAAAGGSGAAARVRALSYAPGAIDTEMQAAARAALPAGPLKARFEDNARSGRLVDPRDSAQTLYDILAADSYKSGAHVDFYSVAAGGTDAASHPLARGS